MYCMVRLLPGKVVPRLSPLIHGNPARTVDSSWNRTAPRAGAPSLVTLQRRLKSPSVFLSEEISVFFVLSLHAADDRQAESSYWTPVPCQVEKSWRKELVAQHPPGHSQTTCRCFPHNMEMIPPTALLNKHTLHYYNRRTFTKSSDYGCNSF